MQSPRWGGVAEQGADAQELLPSAAIGEEAVVTDAHEARWKPMYKEAAEELDAVELQDPWAIPPRIVLPPKGHVIVSECEEA